jgi:KDEL-tailed cysteine endopeptidase
MLYTILLFTVNLFGIVSGCTMGDFDNFKQVYNKTYFNDTINSNRYDIYCKNVNYITDFNKQNNSFVLGINKFTDLTNEEFNSRNRYIPSSKKANLNYKLITATSVPKSLDWRDYNKVTTIKDQGQCGSCWAFSAIGSLEGVNAISTGNLYNLSEQELVDCSTTNNGCGGGFMDNAFKYMMENGSCLYDKYPYIGSDGKCTANKCKSVVNVSHYIDVLPNSETQLLYSLLRNPISVAIDASDGSFQFYKHGIYNFTNASPQLDHGVVLVGFGRDTIYNMEYWIVKNSWGVDWGDSGYIYMLRNIDSDHGMCGIAMDPSYPVV